MFASYHDQPRKIIELKNKIDEKAKQNKKKTNQWSITLQLTYSVLKRF